MAISVAFLERIFSGVELSVEVSLGTTRGGTTGGHPVGLACLQTHAVLLVAGTVETGVILFVASATDVGLKSPVGPPCAVLIWVFPVVAVVTATPKALT